MKEIPRENREIGERLSFLIEERFDNNKAKFGRAVKLPKQAVNNYLNGSSVLGGLKLRILSDEYDVDINWLLTGKGVKPVNIEEEIKRRLKLTDSH